MKSAVCCLITAAAMPVAALAEQADAWPSRTVRIVHGFGASGSIDFYARLLAAQFKAKFGQTAIVDMKPGAGGTIAAASVARSAPDGYTLFLMASGHAAAPGLYSSLPYDPVNDFTVVSMLTRSGLGIVANAKAPFHTIQEMVEQARKRPGGIDYGTPGIGTGPHLAAAFMQSGAGIRLNHIPYKTQGDLNTAAMAGQVPVIMTSLFGMNELVNGGQVKLLAVTSKERATRYPDVPTLNETVLPGFDVVGWTALAGPKGLPASIVAKLNELVRETMTNPQVVENLASNGTGPWITSPEEGRRILAAEVTRWTRMARDEHIMPEN